MWGQIAPSSPTEETVKRQTPEPPLRWGLPRVTPPLGLFHSSKSSAFSILQRFI